MDGRGRDHIRKCVRACVGAGAGVEGCFSQLSHPHPLNSLMITATPLWTALLPIIVTAAATGGTAAAAHLTTVQADGDSAVSL